MDHDAAEDFIGKFYEDSIVLITGGTGFLGKVLVEKLLRAFRVKRIYLLVRVKHNLSADERLVQFFEESIFNTLKLDAPNVFDKLKAIETNYDAFDLNISPDDRTILCNEVDIVFNVVASVKFNEKLRDAIDINVLGTKKILHLATGMKRLRAFLHVSTLYSNCNRESIDERVYESDVGYEKIIEMTRILDDESLDKIQHCLIGEMPNTYTMTKRCSENLVNHQAHFLPAGIFRPPIVLSTYKEPVPGWTDNLYGPSGLCAGAARGLVHAIYGDSAKRANLVPADYCVNAMISAAWDVNHRYSRRMQNQTSLPVYNYIYDENNLTWGRYMQLVQNGLHQPLDKALWCFSYRIISSKALYNVANFALHVVPGYLLDSMAFVVGKKQVYGMGYKKLNRAISMLSYFGLREWNFQNSNIERLSEMLKARSARRATNESAVDRRLPDLEFDMRTIDWNEYFHHYLPGIKKYFYKERVTQKSKNHYKRLYFLHILLKSTVRLAFVCLSCNVLWKLIIKLVLG